MSITSSISGKLARLVIVAGVCWPATLEAAAKRHPLNTVHRRLPEVATITQVTAEGTDALVLTGDTQGRIMKWADAGGWTTVPTGLPGISMMAGIPGNRLAIAEGKVWHSSGWPEWAESIWPDIPLPSALRYLNGTFWAWTEGGVLDAGGNDPKQYPPRLLRSADGLAWAEVDVTSGLPPANSFSDLQWAEGRYVLTGDAYRFLTNHSEHTGGLWISEDGTSWQRVEHAMGIYHGVTYGAGMWLAGGDSGSYATSTDGIAWTVRSHPFVEAWVHNPCVGPGCDQSWPEWADLTNPVWLPSGFHAFSSWNRNAITVVSRDGITWSQAEWMEWDDRPGDARLALVGEQAWLYGSDGTAWRSADWLWAAERMLPLEPSDWSVVLASPQRAVVLGDEGRVGWSDDGTNWQFTVLPGSGVPAAGVWAGDRGEFLAVGVSGDQLRLWRSSDGKSWGNRAVWWAVRPVGLIRGAGRYVLALADGQLLSSPDGLAWTQFITESPKPLRALAFNGHTFVAISARGDILSSSDGLGWTARPRPVDYESEGWWGITAGSGLWVASNGFSSFASDDLISWHNTGDSSVSGDGLTYAFGEFIGQDGRYLKSSTDGVIWVHRRDGYEETHLAAAMARSTRFRDTMLFAGPNGRIFQSDPWGDFIGQWKARVFSPEDLADPATSGDVADIDHDGVPTLLEYALGLDPTAPDALQNIALARLGLTQPLGTQWYLGVTSPSWEDSPGVRVWAERSEDLTSWRRAGITGEYNWYGDHSPNGRRQWSRYLRTDNRHGWLRLRAERIETP